MAHHHSKVFIIGAGPAGYTAAIYAARAGLQPMIVAGMQPGGQMTITTDVENYPGFEDIVQGPWLMEQMQKQAEHVGTQMIYDVVTEVDFSSRPYRASGDSGDTFSGDTAIISTGAQARWLGLEAEEKFMGFGLSACATCDGFFFREKEVAVIGGGNTAVEEALYLTNHAHKVTLIHRRQQLRSEKILQDRLFRNPKVEVLWDHILIDISGKNNPPTVTGAKVQHVKTNEISAIQLDGIFVAIGHDPATKIFEGHLELDEEGYIITQPDSTATNIPGVFAAGDVKDKVYRQAVTAAGMGCMAALEAEKYIGGHSI